MLLGFYLRIIDFNKRTASMKANSKYQSKFCLAILQHCILRPNCDDAAKLNNGFSININSVICKYIDVSISRQISFCAVGLT